MKTIHYNIYCDESCHLENDKENAMTIGSILCPLAKVRETADDIRRIKVRHKLSKKFEIKWTKISPAKIDFYKEIIDYFFDKKHLSFRGIVVPDKSKLRHKDFRQSHDDWYYKMYFAMLKTVLDPRHKYRIYIDIKDTNSNQRVNKLRDVLCNNMLDFNRDIIERIQPVRSHEVQQIQIADLIAGTLSYATRGLTTSSAKTAIIQQVKNKTGYDLTRSTLLRENKFNLFIWQPWEKQV